VFVNISNILRFRGFETTDPEIFQNGLSHRVHCGG